MKTAALALALMATLGMAQADNAPPSGGGPGNNPALEAALKTCSISVAQGNDGRDDPKEMDACMKAKGFEKPAKPPAGAPPSN